MKEILEQKELAEKLEYLRKAVQDFDYSQLYNIIFYNFYSLYLFMSQIQWGPEKENTLDCLLDEIECYIPLGLTKTSLNFFLTAVSAPTQWETAELNKLFSCRCRMDFINLIRMAKDCEEWEKIVNACEVLRQKQEEQYYYFV